ARLSRLDLEQTGVMARLLLGDALPPAQAVITALHGRSDGIPLHVEEILAAMALGAPPGTGLSEPPVPDTLTDAILARRSQLRPGAAAAADAAAIIDRSFGLDLLAGVSEVPAEVTSLALDELRTRYFVVPAANRGWFEFRHALIRDALERATSEAR